VEVDRLLSEDDPPVFRIERPHATSPFVITCDHGGRAIPRRLASLGLGDEELATHVASDLGVAELGRCLSARLDAFVIIHNYSRLVIDPNRPPGTVDSIVTQSEHTHVRANDELTGDEIRRRQEELFHPYHRRIQDELDSRCAAGIASVLVALHSFTPVFFHQARRWHAGALYGRDARLGRLVLAGLRRDHALVVGDNEPYSVSDETDYTVVVHGERRGIPHVELEVRQDLLATERDVAGWAERLGKILEEGVAQMLPP
jgi:predicted N-formylglutamate amidohydrolase